MQSFGNNIEDKLGAVSGGKMDEQTKAVARKINKLATFGANKLDLKKSSKNIASSYNLQVEDIDDIDDIDEEEDDV